MSKSHQRLGGKQRGTKNKATLAREQLVAHSLKSVGLTADEVEALTPLACMRLVMAARLKAGDHAGALVAAEAAAPYCHQRLASADLHIRDEHAGKSDEQLQAEIEELERRIAAAETLH